ncbi:M23 family peptidase [Chryseobacterium nematophagum]|uniref:M23 family peptidase n=1 Tax=Chryseobacterium nematophagum TaxID=2305228 RepID=A0A3M7TFK4_9FLAO|nr:M23 family metallopeptidase [Chryseobacterium nematophagum]RNA61409.1 M23 family peptidase [Chryseobacterium nematophagum]
MKSKLRKGVLFIFVLVSSFSSAQFNTLIPMQEKKPENQKKIEKPKEQSGSKQNKSKKWWTGVFNITTKSDLKSEIDSLKNLIKEYGSIKKDRKAHFEKMKDSLLLLAQNKPEQKDNISTAKQPEAFSKIVMPLQNRISIISSYGVRNHPIFGTKKMHNGIDLKANYENVYSVMDGIVTASGWDPKGGGNYIKVNHFNRFETSYLHLSEMYYSVGETVKAGFIIGKSGNTGNSTGPHLHFAVKEFGKNIHPVNFLNDLLKVNNLIVLYNE